MRCLQPAVSDGGGLPAEIQENELKRFKPLWDEVPNPCGCEQDRRVGQESQENDSSTDRSRQAISWGDRCPVQDSKSKTRTVDTNPDVTRLRANRHQA